MNIDRLLRSRGAIHTKKHFAYTGGTHGYGYANCRFLGEENQKETCEAIAYELLCLTIKNAGLDVSKPITIVGPETLGATLTMLAANKFNAMHDTNIRFGIFAAYTDENKKKQYKWCKDNPSIREICKDTQLVWMDDLLNEGSTFLRTIQILDIFGSGCTIAVIVDRSELNAQILGVKHVESLIKYTMKKYSVTDCPLCAQKVPMVRNMGHGHTFEKNHPNYAGGFINI